MRVRQRQVPFREFTLRTNLVRRQRRQLVPRRSLGQARGRTHRDRLAASHGDLFVNLPRQVIALLKKLLLPCHDSGFSRLVLRHHRLETLLAQKYGLTWSTRRHGCVLDWGFCCVGEG